MPVRLPRYQKQIRASALAEDYELDDASILVIERLFQEYHAERAWESQARADAGCHARKEIEDLAKTLGKLPDQWEAVFSNYYLQRHIIDAYCGHVEVTLPLDESAGDAVRNLAGCAGKLSALTAEFQRLKDTINKVKSRGGWSSPLHPQFSGRPKDMATEKLIRGLKKLAGGMLYPPKSMKDFIEGALKIIGQEFTSSSKSGIRAQKTLRNKISQSRN